MTKIDSLNRRAIFAKKQINLLLKDTGLCFYGINKETDEIYLADRADVYNDEVEVAIGVTIHQLNGLASREEDE